MMIIYACFAHPTSVEMSAVVTAKFYILGFVFLIFFCMGSSCASAWLLVTDDCWILSNCDCVSWRTDSRKSWPSCGSDLTKNCKHCTYHWLVNWILTLSIRRRNENELRNLPSLPKPSDVNTYNSFMRWSWNNSISSRNANIKRTKRKLERFSIMLSSTIFISHF